MGFDLEDLGYPYLRKPPNMEPIDITRPGKLSQFAIENGHRKFVDLASYKMVIFHSYVSLPEGKYNKCWLVVWSMIFIFFHLLGISSSQLTNSYFSEGLKPPTSPDR
jgi:hypothetical protein